MPPPSTGSPAPSNKMHIDTVLARGGRGQDDGRRLAGKYVAPADTPPPPDATPDAPWVALAYDGTPAAVAEAERVLAEVDLSWLPQQGRPRARTTSCTGSTRSPPAWPGSGRCPGRVGKPERAGWATILISWLIMMLMMAALAVLIAILLFQTTPPQNAPDPVPNTASASGGSGSPSPQSGSPSPQTGSASPEQSSGSPEPSGSASESASSPTPNSRL